MQKSESYIQLKDHKPNFRNNPTFRLLNPNKSETGKVAKDILQNICSDVKEKIVCNQWKNSSQVINWFNSIQNKRNVHFIQFDICEFYPIISEGLLFESINWAKKYTHISEEDKEVIIFASQSILYEDRQPWRKKNCQNLFDITMGSFHGAECCELVGLYLLHQLKQINFEGGLYRDDGLGVCYGTKRQNENFKKEICEIFRKIT